MGSALRVVFFAFFSILILGGLTSLFWGIIFPKIPLPAILENESIIGVQTNVTEIKAGGGGGGGGGAGGGGEGAGGGFDSAAGLVSFWNFESYNSTSVNDTIGSGIGVFASGNSSSNIVVGYLGNGLNTSEVSSSVLNITLTTLFANNNSFTIAGWFKHYDGISGDKAAQYFGGLEKQDYQIRVGWSGSGNGFTGDGWECKILTGATAISSIAYSIQPNKWDFLTCTYDKNVLSLYINGELAVAKTFGILNFGSSNTFAIGESRDGDVWNGVIDEVRIYNKSLNSSDVQSLWRLYANTTTYNELARWSDDFVDSIGVNLQDYPNFTGNITPLILSLGIRHVRDTLSLLQPGYDQNKMDGLIGNGVKYGIIADSSLQNATDTHSLVRGALGNLSGQFGSEFIEYVEGPNEPDNFQGNTPNITNLTRQYTIDLYYNFSLDTLTKNISVVAPSMSTYAGIKGIGNLSPWINYSNSHVYTFGFYPGHLLINRELEIWNISAPDRPYKITETGYHTAENSAIRVINLTNLPNFSSPIPVVTEKVQAKYVVRRLFETFNHGINNTYLYQFNDNGNNISNDQLNYGLTRWNFTIKPSYTALNNTILILKEPNVTFATTSLRYSINTPDSRVHHTLLQKSNLDFYLVLWYDILSDDTNQNVTVNLSFTTPISSAALYSPTESAAIQSTYISPTSLALPIPDKIQILRLTPS